MNSVVAAKIVLNVSSRIPVTLADALIPRIDAARSAETNPSVPTDTFPTLNRIVGTSSNRRTR